MKITVKNLVGQCIEFTLDENANIFELRNKISTEFNRINPELAPSDWASYSIKNITDKDGNRLCPIYNDDAADEKLLDFIRREARNPQLKIETLTIYVSMDAGRHYRPTQHNPKGLCASAGAISDSKSVFFQSAINPSDQKNSFSIRLKNIGITSESIPDHLLDPITNEVMDNPVIASNQRTFDLATLQRLNFVDPYLKTPLKTQVMENLKLRSELETFVNKKELEAKMTVKNGKSVDSNEQPGTAAKTNPHK